MTEEQKKYILFSSRYEILNKYLDVSEYNVNILDKIIMSMQEYAELYNTAKLSKKKDVENVIYCCCINPMYSFITDKKNYCFNCKKLITNQKHE